MLFASGASPLLWVTRAVLVGGAVALMFVLGSWLAAASMTVGSFALVFWGLTRASSSPDTSTFSAEPSFFQSDMFGQKCDSDVFGHELDWMGQHVIPDSGSKPSN